MATNKAEVVLSAVDKTRAAFTSVSKSFDDISTKVGGFTGKLGLIGGAVGSAVLALESIKIINVLDQLDDLQEKTGISVESLSVLRFAGEATGTQFEDLAKGIGKLSKEMVSAAGGNKEAAATFDALGISVTNADGTLRTNEEVLGDIADRFAGYKDGAEKAALAQRIFGKSGADMIPFLNQGRAGIKSLADEAKALGVVYDADVARAAADFNDSLVKIKLASEAAAVSIAGPLIKGLADVSGQFLQAKKDGTVFETFLRNASWLNPVGAGINLARNALDGKAASGKTTAEIQADVDRRNPNQARAGGGRGVILGAAPIVGDEPNKKKTGGSKTDPLAEAKRYLESLQKQGEKLREIGVEEEALLSIQKGRIGFVSPALEKEILQTARLIDLKKAETDSLKASEEAAKKAADAASQLDEESIKFFESIATPAEKLSIELERIGKLGENNPLISDELLARASTKAWQDYVATIDEGTAAVSKFDEFSKRAAENIQDSIGTGLVDLMEGNYKNIGDGFAKMLNRMVAEALAADIARSLFGDLVSGGNGKGMAGDLLGSLGGALFGGGGGAKTTGDFARMDRGQTSGGGSGASFASGIGSWLSSLLSFDVGTDFVPQDMVAKIHKGERIVPAAQNKPGYGGVTISNSFTISGPTDRRTQQQIAAAAASGAQRALARNT
jgi:hypothetical protein